MSNFELVREFMQTFEQKVNTKPSLEDHKTRMLRLNLILEEYKELEDAVVEQDLVSIADALTDLLYVVYGSGHAFGIDLDACFTEVHRSNMSKLDANGQVIRREDGKVMKSELYSPPDLKPILFAKNTKDL
jgi:predicted HAD superfamily Cof-like phosphohydrolase